MRKSVSNGAVDLQRFGFETSLSSGTDISLGQRFDSERSRLMQASILVVANYREVGTNCVVSVRYDEF